MPGLEWVAPSITGVFLLVVAVVTVVFNKRNTKYSSDSDHAPDVMEAWREADRARALARRWEDKYYAVRGAFKGFARRMYELYGDAAVLSPREHSTLEEDAPDEEPNKEVVK
jgi:hypothetical protein